MGYFFQKGTFKGLIKKRAHQLKTLGGQTPTLTPLPGGACSGGPGVSDILYKVGIHTKTSKSHSLRSALTSNVFSGGLSLTEIAKAAGWTNVKTFGKFCTEPVIDNNFRNFYWQTACNFIHIFMYCMLRLDVCMIYVVLYIYIYKSGLWNLIWILIKGTGTDQRRNNSKN